MHFNNKVQIQNTFEDNFCTFFPTCFKLIGNSSEWKKTFNDQFFILRCLISKGMFLIKPPQSSQCLIDVTKPDNDKLYCFVFYYLQNLLKYIKLTIS
jgi:hypothetical protein